jgi:hypothetical protein
VVPEPSEPGRSVRGASGQVREGSGGIDAVCAYLDDFRVELIADFQAIYRLNILDVLKGRLDAGYVAELIEGLLRQPASLFRSDWLEQHPEAIAAPDSGEQPRLSFYGWSQDSMLLTSIHNILAALAYQKEAKAHMIDGPTAKPKSRLFAPTIAEFNVQKFYEALLTPT